MKLAFCLISFRSGSAVTGLRVCWLWLVVLLLGRLVPWRMVLLLIWRCSIGLKLLPSLIEVIIVRILLIRWTIHWSRPWRSSYESHLSYLIYLLLRNWNELSIYFLVQFLRFSCKNHPESQNTNWIKCPSSKYCIGSLSELLLFFCTHILVNIGIVLILISSLLSFTSKIASELSERPTRIIIFSSICIWEHFIGLVYLLEFSIFSVVMIGVMNFC